MRFKVGDMVMVSKPHDNYTITGVGSYGIVREVYERTCNVEFYYTTKIAYSVTTWKIMNTHLAPATKLSKFLMGEDNETEYL